MTGMVLLFAVWIDLGPIHALHTSDSIVPILTSLQKWTLFYWEANRFGMLVPLMAMPFDHPFANLLVQSGITVFLGLYAFFLLVRYQTAEPQWPAIGAMAVMLFGLSQPASIEFQYLSTAHVYGASICLSLAGLVTLYESSLPKQLRLCLASLLWLCALWVNMAMVFFLVPVILCQRVLPSCLGSRGDHQGRSLTVQGVVIVLIAFVSVYLASRYYPYRGHYVILQPDQWLPAIGVFLRKTWIRYLRDGLFLGSLAVLIAGALARLLLPTARRPRVARSGALLIGAAVYFAAMGVLDWTKGASRFALPTVITACVVCLVWGVSQMIRLIPVAPRRYLNVLSFCVLAAIIGISSGLPSVSGARASLDARLGSVGEEVVASRATHVIGTYWKVWMAVFHAHLISYERDMPRRVWGISRRSLPTESLWRAVPPCEMLLAARADDVQVERMRQRYALPELVVVGRMRDIITLRPQCPDQNRGPRSESVE